MKTASTFRIPPEEMNMIRDLLGKDPTLTEEAVFSAMWSEHCSYKSSRVHLRAFSSRHPRVVSGPGENAGIVHLRDGLCLAFKMESHNHPSYLEPFQGAATGVGGILRDIIAMGARPIAVANSLVFGSLRHPFHRTLFRRVVEGIAGYGNPIGVPTVGGEIWFDDRYQDNILVNVLAMGVVEDRSIMTAKAPREGLLAIYIGNRTGRDGVSGAAMASRGFSSESGDLRPQVQIADPYAGKNLMEATLEIARRRLAEAVQDMGAAGITSSSTEMAGRAGLGMEIDVEKVPLREFSMEPWEILLSESQERMLVLADPKNVEPIRDIATRWHLSSDIIGHTITEPHFIVRNGQRVVADIPIAFLTDDAPLYTRPSTTLPSSPDRHPFPPSFSGTHSLSDLFRKMLESPNGGDPRWIYRHFDFEVQTRTVLGPGHDASVLDLKDRKGSAVALSVVSLPHACSRDPFRGGRLSVAKAVTELAAVGAFPLGMTDCLNFGNPENPAIMGTFQDAVRGIASAGIALDIPVVSGNVSLYNETNGKSIPPTPMIGMTGLLSSVRNRIGGRVAGPGFRLALVGRMGPLDLGGSYLDWILGEDSPGPVPDFDAGALNSLVTFMSAASMHGRISASRAIGRGGLIRSLLLFLDGDPAHGVFMELDEPVDPVKFFFSEAPGRLLLAYRPEEEFPLSDMALETGVPFKPIGYSASHRWMIRYRNVDLQRKEWTESLHDLKNRYRTSLSQYMEELP